MESKRTYLKLNVFFLLSFLVTSFTVEARNRRGFAKKYVIPPLNQSHIVMGSALNSELDPNSIKILIWNLLKAERAGWAYDFKNMSSNKDILLLQEGYLSDITEYTFSELDTFRFDMGVSFLYKNDNNIETGTIVGSKVVPSETGFKRTKDFEPFIKTPKTITYGVYPIAGTEKELMVISIHGMNFTKQYAFNNQVRQALELLDRHDGPAVFAGDFNTRTKKRLKFLRTKMKVRGFKELSYTDDKRMAVFGNVLDHTFTKGLLVREAKVLKHIKTSDHKAMELDLVLDSSN
jgi:endonuclease/exonuclease/phosphatase (EEP) superfamily protein YafD